VIFISKILESVYLGASPALVNPEELFRQNIMRCIRKNWKIKLIVSLIEQEEGNISLDHIHKLEGMCVGTALNDYGIIASPFPNLINELINKNIDKLIQKNEVEHYHHIAKHVALCLMNYTTFKSPEAKQAATHGLNIHLTLPILHHEPKYQAVIDEKKATKNKSSLTKQIKNCFKL